MLLSIRRLATHHLVNTSASSPCAGFSAGRVHVRGTLSSSSAATTTRQQPLLQQQQQQRRHFARASAWRHDTVAIPEDGLSAAFKNLMQIDAPDVVLRRAAKKSASAAAMPQRLKRRIHSERQRELMKAMASLTAFDASLKAQLDKFVASCPATTALHPFEAELVELTLDGGRRGLATAIAGLQKLRNKQDNESRFWLAKLQNNGGVSAPKVRETHAAAMKAMRAAFDKGGTAPLATLGGVYAQLRRLPSVYPHTPTVALVGAPNVGKSSLVAALSSGKPEIQNYPFTTRGVSCGHIFVAGERHQVIDTPGLLNRPPAERNRIERFATAVLRFLPRPLILYIVDASGHSGTTLADQLMLRDRIVRSRLVSFCFVSSRLASSCLFVCLL
jgi:nucleolar GTP-binding protein